jgi:hypothetical protein
MSYYKKQKKHTRSVYINTDDAYYVNPDRTQFSFRINPINIEDESLLYVKNTNVDYKTSGLAIKNITPVVLLPNASFASTYNTAPSITFNTADGKGTGALGVGILASSGVSGSASSTTLTVNATSVGQGYTGTASLYVGTAIPPASGGTGATITSGTIDSINGGLSAVATLTAGSGYFEVPIIPIPPAPASVPAILSITYTPSTGVLTGISVSNPTLNGFYNTNLFTIGVVNNPIQLTGILSTNASGTITSITITNTANNGFYSDTGNPVSILTINGVAPTGAGADIGYNYNQGRCDNASIYSGGSGYGANLVNAVIGFPVPATPTNAVISGKTISAGRLTALTLSSGGTKYYNPSVNISQGLMTPINASYEPVFKIASSLLGVKMISNGRGYTSAPNAVISTASRVVSGGDIPLLVETAPTSMVEPNKYYTIKADGFHFNRTLYTNTDNKGTPTIAVCSTSENVNNEDYIELVLPAQVINDFTLTITDRDGAGLEATKNMTLLLTIEELDEKHSLFHESKRQEYPLYSVS